MKERPILFSGEMVRAILDGKKTETRRIVEAGEPSTWCPTLVNFKRYTFDLRDPRHVEAAVKVNPYGVPGDRLWVRETWAGDDGCGFVYRADHPTADLARGDLDDGEQTIRRWHPAIHMRRAASRLSLEIVSVRVERLQDVTEEDAKAEGVSPEVAFPQGVPVHLRDFFRSSFHALWDHINGKRAPWSSNPWVWAITFRLLDKAAAQGAA